jgi:hypothetical protein
MYELVFGFSVVRCSRAFERFKSWRVLRKKNGFLLSHVFWRAFNFNYRYILLCIS